LLPDILLAILHVAEVVGKSLRLEKIIIFERKENINLNALIVIKIFIGNLNDAILVGACLLVVKIIPLIKKS